MRRLGLVVLVLVLAAAVFAARRWHAIEINRTEMTSTVSKHIETAGLTADTLLALEAGDTEKARTLLRNALGYSLERAEEITKTGVPPFDPGGRGYAAMLTRARDYAERTQLGPDAVRRADQLITGLSR